VAIAALVFSLTSRGAAAPSIVTPVAWHKLTLLHGWQSPSASGLRAASCGTDGKVVYLSGTVQIFNTNPINGMFAVLPRACRPSDRLEALTANGAMLGPQFLNLTVYPNGDMWLLPTNGTDINEGASLNFVTYPRNE
jgi:hypothetical protein